MSINTTIQAYPVSHPFLTWILVMLAIPYIVLKENGIHFLTDFLLLLSLDL